MTMTLAPRSLLDKVSRPPLEDRSAPPILAIGFRPFFLLATLTAVIWIPLWIALIEGTSTPSHFPPTLLHAHEMLFGFVAAVIAGFLLTAGANWTQLRTTSGSGLSALAVLWVAGRLAMLFGGKFPWVVALIDVSFLPAVGATLAVPLLRTKSARNFQFLVMLGLLTLANGLMHIGASPEAVALLGIDSLLGQTLALRAITFMIFVMGGRVIPMFTRSGTGHSEVHAAHGIDRVALLAFFVSASASLVWGPVHVVGLMLSGTGLLHLFRMRTWGSQHASAPLLWILHAGYACVALSLLLEGLAAWGWVPASSAIHLLTVGGIGGLCLGMMTRVSLGHSGRMLVAPRMMSKSFMLLMVATLVRVLGPVVLPNETIWSYRVSGASWAVAFLLLLVFGWPIWTQPRVDDARKERP